MKTEHTVYDVAIIGGGLAGLCLSVQLSIAGYDVILFEKERYPFHKVCGEYISYECWNFLEELGVPLSDWNLPHINKLLVSAVSGKILKAKLDLGGFGISRYKLDGFLANLTRSRGAIVREGCRVENVWFGVSDFHVQYEGGSIKARQVCGAFGKRSNLDIRLKRQFIQKKHSKLNNYIGVKYHVRSQLPANEIALHNFDSGYCGISRVEDEKYCLCYLTTAHNLQRSNNSIREMEKNILSRNPHLAEIFREAKFIDPNPVTIAQISFDAKTQFENHMLMAGDAAGMIAPLCGNGMSMAMHASKIAFEQLNLFLSGKVSRAEMESAYQQQWNEVFAARLKTGRFIQSMFGREWLTHLFLFTLHRFPAMVNKLIKKTHGEPF